MGWARDAALRIVVKAFKVWAPDLVAKFLGELRPLDISDRIEPALRSVVMGMEPEWRPVFAKALRLLADVARGIADMAENYRG